MRIEFAQFTSWNQVELAAMAMEVTAAVTGICLFEDLPIDEDQIFSEMLENPEEFGIENGIGHLIEEDFEGRQLAREKFGYSVSNILECRQHRLCSAYSFKLDIGSEPSLMRCEVDPINRVCFSALFALTLFLLLEDREVVQISEHDCDEFRSNFSELFELISAIAFSAAVEGTIWWTGQHRGHRSFLQQLDEIARKVGNGAVKSEDQLEENQVNVNDGGIDAIGVSTYGGVVEADAVCFLLGATYQRKLRKNKIIGESELTRFKAFFASVPTVAFLGILSIPYRATPAEAQDCRDRNCVYFPREVIERNLGIASTKEYVQGVLPYIVALNRRMHEKLTLAVNGLKIVKVNSVSGIKNPFP